MTIRMPYIVMQLLFYCALIKQIVITEAIVLSILNKLDDQWTFQEGANITLVCTIDPYTTIQDWKFNNIKVAECASTTCITYNNESGVFTFTQFINITYGVFYWNINPMKIEFKNKVIACNDGSKEVKQTLTIPDQNSDNKITSSKDEQIGLGAGLGVGIPVVILLGFVVYKFVSAKVPQTPTEFSGERESESEISLRWIRGNNGGSPQKFIIINARTGDKKTIAETYFNRKAQKACQFKVTGQECQTFSLVAENRKGTSAHKYVHLSELPEVVLEVLRNKQTIQVVLRTKYIYTNGVTKIYMKTDGIVNGLSDDHKDTQLSEYLTSMKHLRWIRDSGTVNITLIGLETKFSVNMTSSKTNFKLFVYCERKNQPSCVAISNVEEFDIKNGIREEQLQRIRIPFNYFVNWVTRETHQIDVSTPSCRLCR